MDKQEKLNRWIDDIEKEMKSDRIGETERLQLQWRKKTLMEELRDYCDKEYIAGGLIW